MEKGEEATLQKRLGIDVFPTIFVFDGDGKVLLKPLGTRDAKVFLKELKEVTEE